MARANKPDGLYTTRMKLFVAGCVVLFIICLVRLVHIQLWPGPELREGLERLKDAGQQHEQFSSLRGDILDRNGVLLATDSPSSLCSSAISWSSMQIPMYDRPPGRRSRKRSKRSATGRISVRVCFPARAPASS